MGAKVLHFLNRVGELSLDEPQEDVKVLELNRALLQPCRLCLKFREVVVQTLDGEHQCNMLFQINSVSPHQGNRTGGPLFGRRFQDIR